MSQTKKNELARLYRKLVNVKNSRAGLRNLSIKIAKAITNNEISANEGANIMWCVWDKLNKPAHLSPFVGLASEYKDYQYHQNFTSREELQLITVNKIACIEDIIQYANKISNLKY
jgi:hypothetical protein